MKKHLLWVLPLCVLCGAMIFGIVKRETYIDALKQENYLDQLLVAEIHEQFAEAQCSNMLQNLPQVPIILRVEAVGEIEHLFHVSRQKIIIREVYAGEGLAAGEEYYLFARAWRLSLDGYYNAINTGYVNMLEAGTEYLVFVEDVLEDLKGDLPALKVYDDGRVSTVPVFCYEDRQSVVIPLSEDPTYVPYKDVKDNEFFATSEKGLEMLEALKGKILSLYPR